LAILFPIPPKTNEVANNWEEYYGQMKEITAAYSFYFGDMAASLFIPASSPHKKNSG